MLEYWFMVMIGVIVVVAAVCTTLVLLQRRSAAEARLRSTVKVYEALLHAVTDLNTTGGDEYRIERAKMQLAYTLNRLNLVGSPEVLRAVGDLLDFLNETRDGELDVLKQVNIMNAIVRAVRYEIDAREAAWFDKAQFRFRFYNPKKRS